MHVCDFVVVRIKGSMFFERLFGNFRNLYNSTTDNNNVRELQMYYCKLLSNSQKHLRTLHKKCRCWNHETVQSLEDGKKKLVSLTYIVHVNNATYM